MKLYYKSENDYSYQLKENGYFQPSDEQHEYFLLNYINTFYNEINPIIVEPHRDGNYFHEIEIVNKINNNKDNYFNFDKAILDIGAHLGFYSFYSKFKYVYAFEPNKTYFTLMNTNLLIYDKIEYSKTYNVLLSNKPEDVEYYGFHTKLTDQSNDFLTDEIESHKIIVKSHTLDEFNLNNIGFIKIDVEGMEEKVLKGGAGTIVRNNYPPILFELWDVDFYGMTQEKHDSLKNFLESLGYEIIWYWGNDMTHLAIHK